MHRAPCQHRVHTNKKKNPNLYGRKQKCATAHRRQLDMFDGLCVRMQCVCDGVRYRGFKFFGQRLRNACASAHVEMAVCRVPMHVFAGHITIFFFFFLDLWNAIYHFAKQILIYYLLVRCGPVIGRCLAILWFFVVVGISISRRLCFILSCFGIVLKWDRYTETEIYIYANTNRARHSTESEKYTLCAVNFE